MACGSGCCGPPRDATPASPETDRESLQTTGLPPVASSSSESVNAGALTDHGASARDAASKEGDDCCAETRQQPSKSEQVIKKDQTGNCQSGCCPTNADVEAGPEEKSDCCGPSTRDMAQETAPGEVVDSCQSGCCSKKPTVQKAECCETKSPQGPPPEQKPSLTDDAADDCKTGCCSPKPAVKESAKAPPCCEGKISPCCDTSCIDRLAMRECEAKNCSDSTCSGNDDQAGRAQPGSERRRPCRDHARSAYARYRAQLEALGCICRALLALGQESCCAPPQGRSSGRRTSCRSSIASTHASAAGFSSSRSNSKSEKKKGRGTEGSASVKPGCSKGCCSEPKVTPLSEKDDCSKGCCDKPKVASVAKDNCSKGCCGGPKALPHNKDSCSKGCCSETKAAPRYNNNGCVKNCCDEPKVPLTSTKVSCSEGCCGEVKAPSPSVASCIDDCCNDEEPSRPTEKTNSILDNVTSVNDPERGGLTGKEHVILAISGMTCTGCETKLQRTLANVDSVTQLKTSLVLARAEFDVNLSLSSPGDVIKHLERTTEFKCERVTNQGSTLDLICPGDPADFVNRKWPDGVPEIKVVDRKTIRVDFDAKVTGARDLVESGWDTPMQLAPPQPDRTLDAGSRHVRHVGYMTLASIILTVPVLALAWAPLPDKELAYASASLALATIVQVVIAGPFYPKALKSMVFSRVIEMDLLIVLSTSTAYIFSVVSFAYLAADKPLSTDQFFETSTLLITLIMVGRYVAAFARQKAVESISIRSLQTTTATIIDEAGSEIDLDSRLLQFGDTFKVAPESRIPTDGTVISGHSEVDESMMTGESQPVEKYPGCVVVAGSINGSGTLRVRLTRLPGDNTISTIASMVDEAKLSKPKIQELADRVATYFVPVVVALTIITFVVWIAIGAEVRNKSGSNATIDAVTYAITVLIVSCPCAIGLAVPMVIVVATGVAAERGVIFKSADSIELAYKTRHVVFDKTGTLTQGKLKVIREEYIGEQTEEAKSSLLALLESIKHPVSRAVVARLKEQGVAPSATVSNAKSVVGKGVEGQSLDDRLRAGNSRWLDLATNPIVESIQSQGHTAFCFSVNDAPVAFFGLADSLRSDALPTVSQLQASGVTVHVLSGDDDGAVRAVAAELGISDTHVRSRCTPAEKQAYIKDLLSCSPADGGGKKKTKAPVVIFCGDGTNDAAALAQATIGIHINEGTDIAKSAADVVLMRPSLTGIATAISVSRKSIHRIAFNFGWSFVYNLFAVLLASGAFVNARIPPAFAGLGELVSVLPVIAAAIMLRWARI